MTSTTNWDVEDDYGGRRGSAHLLGPFSYVPVEVAGSSISTAGSDADLNGFATLPLLGPLLFDNDTSDARDHCANERTFLAALRLSIYMSVVAVAITVSFHLRAPPSALEVRLARPLGLVFWLLSLACLVVGLCNYISTVNGYSRKAALVQSGWGTHFLMSSIALFIFGTCVALLVIDRTRTR